MICSARAKIIIARVIIAATGDAYKYYEYSFSSHMCKIRYLIEKKKKKNGLALR